MGAAPSGHQVGGGGEGWGGRGRQWGVGGGGGVTFQLPVWQHWSRQREGEGGRAGQRARRPCTSAPPPPTSPPLSLSPAPPPPRLVTKPGRRCLHVVLCRGAARLGQRVGDAPAEEAGWWAGWPSGRLARPGTARYIHVGSIRPVQQSQTHHSTTPAFCSK